MLAGLPLRLMPLLMALAIACAAPDGEPTADTADDPIVARYAGETLRASELRRRVQRLPPRVQVRLRSPEGRRAWLDNFIQNELLVARGVARGYDRDPEIREQVDDFERRLIVQRILADFQEPPELSDDDVRAYFDANRRLFSGASIRARHILVGDEVLATRLHAELQEHPERFEALVAEHSTDGATIARGGDLGYFRQGRMAPELERAAFRLEEPGDISPPVRTPFGYHIIKLEDRRGGKEPTFEEARGRIRAGLLATRKQEVLQQRFDALRDEGEVEIMEDVLAALELPAGSGAAAAGGHGMATSGGH